ncbi:F-box/FBD/LRR-repeat protein At1g13570 [Linum grandiflorum]
MNPLAHQTCTSNPSISKLPADVIALILTFLPIREAVRTSILSRQWRHSWRSIPDLVFDRNFAAIDPALTNQDKLALNIFQTLMGHEGPSLNKFELAIPGMSMCPRVHPLIRFLSTKHVKELSLIFALRFRDPLDIQTCSILPFPDLTSLKLQGFKFVLPHSLSVGFSKLTVLDLADLILPSGFYEDFLPLCPLLEELKVIDRNLNNKKPVFAAPRLRVLLFNSSFRSISFKNTARLSVLSILDVGEYDYSNSDGFFAVHKPDMVALFNALPALEELNIGIELLLFLSEGHVPRQLPVTLHNLKVLQASNILLDRLPEAQVLLSLLRSSPNLQKLTIVVDVEYDYHPASKFMHSLRILLAPDYHLGALEEFSIQNSRGTQVEMDLVKSVLANAPKLKRVFLEPMKDLCFNTMLKFLAEVTKFKRVSKEAEVNYVLPNANQA